MNQKRLDTSAWHTLWESSIGLAERFGRCLQQRQQVFACAESCTGGLIASLATSVAGSSRWFDRGLVTYSNQAKVSLLGVSPEDLKQFGAVSEAVAKAMAAGVLAQAEAVDIAVSTTGIAGPGGATPGKPVGLVCMGFAQRHKDTIKVRALTEVFPGDRQQVRLATVHYVLTQALLEFGLNDLSC